jgi:hypothetical protein
VNEPCPDHDKLLQLLTEFHEFRKSNEDRLEKLNELREQVTSDRGIFLRRDMYEQYHGSHDLRIAAVEQWQARIAGIGIVIVAMVGLIGVALGHLWR